MKVLVVYKRGLEIVDGIRSLNQAIMEAEKRELTTFDLIPQKGHVRGYVKDPKDGTWYPA